MVLRLFTEQMLMEYCDLARRRYNVRIIEKRSSSFMRMLATLMFFNKSFLDGYITTIGTTIYWPDRDRLEFGGDRSFNTLFHEVQHAVDFHNHPLWFILSYLAPQFFAIWVLLALLAIFFGPWWLLWLLALLFLLPFPSIGRTIWEMRGYSCEMALCHWGVTHPDQDEEESLVDMFTGPDYYFMWPFEKGVVRLINKYRKNIESGKLTEAQKMTYSFLERHGMVNRYATR